MRPLFYNLAPDPVHGEVLKLDGLACSFMINAPNYTQVYENLARFLTFGFKTTFIATNGDSSLICREQQSIYEHSQASRAFSNGICAYALRLAKNLLYCMPPPVSLLRKWDQTQEANDTLEPFRILLAFRFFWRNHDAASITWLRVSLRMIVDN